MFSFRRKKKIRETEPPPLSDATKFIRVALRATDKQIESIRETTEAAKKLLESTDRNLRLKKA